MSREEFYEVVAQANALPLGRAKTDLVEHAVRIAHRDGHDLRETNALIALTVNLERTGSFRQMFTPFARLLHLFDESPDLVENFEQKVLWRYKWMFHAVMSEPRIPREQAEGMLDDFERRVRGSSRGMHAVHTQRCRIAWHLDGADAARDSFDLWQRTPRDRLSDCKHCEPSTVVHFLSATGRAAEAVERGERALTYDVGCPAQPHGLQTALLSPLVETGRYERAAELHVSAYARLCERPPIFGQLAAHLLFLVRTGNRERGLAILQRHLPALDPSAAPLGAAGFMTIGARILDDALRDGVDGAVHLEGRTQPFADAVGTLERRAWEVTLPFDERAGNDRQLRLLRELRDTSVRIDRLPIPDDAG